MSTKSKKRVLLEEFNGKMEKIVDAGVFVTLISTRNSMKKTLKRVFPKNRFYRLINSDSVYFKYRIFTQGDKTVSVISKLKNRGTSKDVREILNLIKETKLR